MTRIEHFALKRLPLAIAIVATLQVAPAFAADQPSPHPSPSQSTAQQSDSGNQDAQTTSKQDQAKQDQAQNLGGMTVTGSLLKRPEYQTTAPVQVINLKADLATGAFDTADLLQTAAVASGATQINGQFSGYIVDGGTGVKPIDLRGLGANRTLVLLDGQRPGPAGTRGAVGSFDLNVVPSVILGRVEIVKDGSSSIYGSDAISGVVNLITRKRIDGVEMNASVAVPQHGGGQQTTASIGAGWNFDSGHVLVAGQVQKQSPLALGDRSFTSCPQDLVWGADGQRIDRADHSILQGTALAGCDNLYANTILRYADGYHTRYVPSKDGSTDGPFTGYHPRPYPSTRYGDGNPDGAYYEDVLNFPFSGNEWLINKNQNSSLYASAGFNFGGVNWDSSLLFNHRETRTRGYRQFFPLVVSDGGPIQSDYSNLYLPIMPYPSNDKVDVDYLYLTSKLSGLFESTDSWSWEVNGSYSRSHGTYGHVGIDARVTGDLTSPANERGTPPINYFDPGILSGERMGDLVNAIGLKTQGETTYKQLDFNALFTGNLATLPAGDVSSAFGLEFRQTRINDQPDPNNAAGFEWGYTSAQVTKGADNVREAFGEVGIPLLKGLPGIESLSVDVSGRVFRYNSVRNWDHVWKTGLSWQISPTWRVRGSLGTSYRAPGLYELYLGNQTGFLSQMSVDPCINWSDSTNDNIRAHCEAAGIPGDYGGAGSSATSHQGGGKGFLNPETSRAKSVGIVWTPTFGNFNMALDYFDYDIKGEISTLSASTIVGSCYSRPVYPNNFCDLFTRKPASDPGSPFMITDIYATFINLNQERTRGYDLQMDYSDDFAFGKLSADMQVTYTLQDTLQEFDSAAASGFSATNFVGDIGRPKTVGLGHVSLKRGDWTYSWEGRYTSSTDVSQYYDATFNYFGYDNATRDIKAKWQFRHSVSVGYDKDKWGILFGIRNLFDQEPDTISSGLFARKGNVPLAGSQYDWFGRTFFLRTHYDF
ncbi:MAG: TonB-dependent receptor [Rhodanobacteraceae bacterium]